MVIVKGYGDDWDDFVVFYIDFDDFKCINDDYGYDIGDCVFCVIVECFCELFCDYDLIVCFGGDEFVVVLVGGVEVVYVIVECFDVYF